MCIRDSGSRFDAHIHGGGEEYLVIEGTFSDESGDYPAGTYVRNPVGTQHRPHTDPGCVIFVKLHQFDPSDQAQFDISLDAALAATPGAATLHETEAEQVEVFDLAAGTHVEPARSVAGGTEVLVLSGEALLNETALHTGSWARWPVGQAVTLTGGASGARLWVKSGHLAHVQSPDQAA